MLGKTCLVLAVVSGTVMTGTGTAATAEVAQTTGVTGATGVAAVTGVAGGAGVAGAAGAAGVARWPWPAADAVIRNAAGREVGVLRVEHQLYNRSRVTVRVKGLRPGYHGFHIHAKGVCDPASVDPVTGSPFFSAGPHFTLRSAVHGDHSGDLPNLLVAADGTGEAVVVTDRFRVGQLFDRDGSSVVIHALPDNHANIPDRYTHQPDSTGTRGPDAETRKAGDSGGRVACGVIIRRQESGPVPRPGR
ncbi:Cu-Zn family superoxide dismutase [Streptosporangium becharense]|uniref:Superoxide dismutase [Cu-Zn] n=1 Tax=Streptosporangium becharense TaxID=1816182 RepID=A0A7W9IIV4_9ACTN|nr:superoxide dismutase family protein [Streptosporangium becharense]MBB2911415.1 Cu-Zn family superoxide dismutase [Streptosporangium becharense]MBB5821527.1 Cu-Zn family superoxide dismutase [Streptosporangium becharense]